MAAVETVSAKDRCATSGTVVGLSTLNRSVIFNLAGATLLKGTVTFFLCTAVKSATGCLSLRAACADALEDTVGLFVGGIKAQGALQLGQGAGCVSGPKQT